MAPGLIVLGSRPKKKIPPWVAIFDHDGVPRWWYLPDTRPINPQVLRGGGKVAWSRAFGDGYGRDPRQAQEIHTLSGKLVRLIRTHGWITDPHEFTQEANGRFLAESYIPYGPVDLSRFGGPARAAVVYPDLQELSPAGRLLRRWNLRRQLTPDQTDPAWWPTILGNPKRRRHGRHRSLPTYDVTHVNAIEPWGHQLVISTRHTNAIYGISRRNGAVLWKLGGTPTPESLTVIGDPYPADQLFSGEHDVRVLRNGLLTVFDNAAHLRRRPRGVIYRLDLESRTATFVAELTDPKAHSGNCCGSVRPIPGGWLVGYGGTPLVTGFNKNGDVAFRLWWSNSYRAVAVPPGRVSLRRLDRGLERMEPH